MAHRCGSSAEVLVLDPASPCDYSIVECVASDGRIDHGEIVRVHRQRARVALRFVDELQQVEALLECYARYCETRD